jgi:hypothetical protein
VRQMPQNAGVGGPRIRVGEFWVYISGAVFER